MKHSTIFKSRWMALLWGAGILWLAYDVAASVPQESNSAANAGQATDAAGTPVTADDEKKFAQALNGL